MTRSRLTDHPLQRIGARSVAALAHKPDPDALTAADLACVRVEIRSDILRAASACRGGSNYGWWKVLFATFPNAPFTHAKRAHANLPSAVEQYLAPDVGDAWQCIFCGAPTGRTVTKTSFPMFGTDKFVNAIAIPGWPACSFCRLAAAALPYGCVVSAKPLAAMLSESTEVERRMVEDNVRINQQTIALGMAEPPVRSRTSLEMAVQVLRTTPDAHGPATLWVFSNANNPAEASVRGRHFPLGTAEFLAALTTKPRAARGWAALGRALSSARKPGQATGSACRAALLAVEEIPVVPGLPRHQLLAKANYLARIADQSNWPRTVAIGACARLYAEEVIRMTPADMNKIEETATFLAGWIAAKSARSRFQQVRGATRAYELGAVLRAAEADSVLTDSRGHLPLTTAAFMLAGDQKSQVARQLLLFGVVERLYDGGVVIPGTGDDTAETDATPEVESLDMAGLDNQQEYA